MKASIITILALFMLSVTILLNVIIKQQKQIKYLKNENSKTTRLVEQYQLQHNECFELLGIPEVHIRYSLDGKHWSE